MDRPLLFASTVCTLAVVGEALFMGRGGSRFMKTLKQPSFAPPTWAWSVIGFAYYVICFYLLYRLTGRPVVDWLATALLVLLMAANTVWNYVYFRRRDLRMVFWYSLVYAVFAVVLLALLARFDRVAALVLLLYVAYLPYALALFYRVWRLNP